MLHNKTPNDWPGLKKDASDPVQTRYNLYIPDAQKAKAATENEQSFGATYYDYDSESGIYSGSDSAASVYSLLGVSPPPSLITESMIPWDDFVTEIKDFESWLQETLSD